MNIPTGQSWKLAIGCFAVLALNGAAVGQASRTKPPSFGVLVQSELDYLRGANSLFTLHLKQGTLKQAFEQIARTTGVSIAYEGELTGSTGADIDFTAVTLKQMLSTLGERLKVSYRVDPPDNLTVLGPPKH